MSVSIGPEGGLGFLHVRSSPPLGWRVTGKHRSEMRPAFPESLMQPAERSVSVQVN
jgi:hypothetical protein